MPMIQAPQYYILAMSDGSMREVYRREPGGRLFIAYVSGFNSNGFANIEEIKDFYNRNFNLRVEEVVS